MFDISEFAQNDKECESFDHLVIQWWGKFITESHLPF
jgi:hypothetical protein